MKKRIVSFLLAAVMVLGIVPFAALPAFAEGTPLYYKISGEEADKTLYLRAAEADGYTVFDSSQLPPWKEEGSPVPFSDVKAVSIEETIAPDSIAYWFCTGTSPEAVAESGIRSFSGLDNLDTGNVKNADYAFAGVRNAELTFDGLDLRAAESAEGMFRNSAFRSVQSDKIPAAVSDSLKNAAYMFAGCFNLTEVVCPELGDGVNAEGMFADTTNLNTFRFRDNSSHSAADCFKGFLKGSSVMHVDVTEWTPTPGSDISEMFAGCKRLTRISAAPGADWSAAAVSSTDLFSDCSMLVGGEGTVYSAYDTGFFFARTDRAKSAGIGAEGYFTDMTANTGLTVTRNGAAAISGTDYVWDGNKLVIKTSGLTVSGTTDAQYVFVNADVTDLTIEDLFMCIVGNHAIAFKGNCTLTLKGDNVISTAVNGCHALHFSSDGAITGSGNLTASGSTSAIYSFRSAMTISASGRLMVRGGTWGLEMGNSLRITNAIGRMLIYGEDRDRGAATWTYSTPNGNNVSVWSQVMKGSVDINVPELEITEDAVCYGHHFCFRVHGETARSVLLSHAAHDFSEGVYRSNGETHSRVCTCGYIDTPAAHDYTALYFDNGDGTHCGRCSCGAVNSAQKVKHKFVDGVCVCGAVKAPVSEYFIIGGKAIGGGVQSDTDIRYDGLADSTIYVEEGTEATLLIYAAEERCWRYTEKTGEGWSVIYGDSTAQPVGDDFIHDKVNLWATITVPADAAANDSITVQSALYKDEPFTPQFYDKTVTTTVKVVSRKDLAKNSIAGTTYPLYLTVGSGLVSLDPANGTHYIASDYEIGTKKQEYSDTAADCLDASLADSADFAVSEDGTVFGILDGTGEKTGAYISGIDTARVLDVIAAYNEDKSHSASYVYAADGKLITNSSKANYEVTPIAIKMLNSQESGEIGWYINTAIKRKAIVKYDIHTPNNASFTYRMLGSTSKTVYTTTVPGDVNAEAILEEGLGVPVHTKSGTSTNVAVNDTVPVRYNNKDYDVTFLGWNTAADGSGTMYAPGDMPDFRQDTTLYAIWGASYSVFYYKDSYSMFSPSSGRIGTASLLGAVGSTISVSAGDGAGELNYKKSAVGEDAEYYNDGITVTSAVITPDGNAYARVLYSKIEHVHTAGEAVMNNDTAHWHTCGSTAGKCELETKEDYEAAFAADTDGALKAALGYEEHDFSALLVDNKDGTHSSVCFCGVKDTAEKVPHVFDNGKCFCGAEEEVPSVNFGTFSYCGSRDFYTSVGAGRGFYWGISIDQLYIKNNGFEQLESISVREFGAGGTYTLYIFTTEIWGKPNMYSSAYTQQFSVGGTSGWKTVTLDQPYTVTPGKNVWIVLYCDNIVYPATACEYVGNQNGSYLSFDGMTWSNVCDAGISGTWMIKANFNSEHVHSYTDGVCEGCGELEPVPANYDGCFSYTGSRDYVMSWDTGYPAYWGIRIPDGTVPYSHLSKVRFYQGDESGHYRLLLYSVPSGTAPSDVYHPDYAQEFAVDGEPGWITIELDTPYAMRRHKDLWIIFYSEDVSKPVSCTGFIGNPDGLLLSDGAVWHSSIDEGYYYSGLVKGCFENLAHTHVAGTSYMRSGSAHWLTCDAKDCPLGSSASYEAAFAADTDGSLKAALGYGEHSFNELTDNGNGTHSRTCSCGLKDTSAKVPHVFNDGVCEGCGCFEPAPVDYDGWFSYTGSRTYQSALGITGGSYWGIRVPAAKIGGYSHLSKVQVYKGTANGNYKLLLFLTAAGSRPTDLNYPDYEQTFSVSGEQGWVTLELSFPFRLEGGYDLWILFYSDDVARPVTCTGYVNTPDSLWLSDGTALNRALDMGYYYSCMLKGFFVTLDTAKEDAIAEINAARSVDNARIADLAVTDISTALTVEEIRPIKTRALADMAAADALAKAKNDAVSEINAAISVDNAEIADQAIDRIRAAEKIDQIEPIKTEALAAMAAADALAKAKRDAIEEITVATTTASQEIAAAAIARIEAETDLDQIISIKKTALADMKAADELAEERADAIAKIEEARTDANAAIADDAIRKIYAADDVGPIKSILETALAEMAAADALARVRANAITKIEKAKTADNAEIANAAIGAINAAVDAEEIGSILETALADMKAADVLAQAKKKAIREIDAAVTSEKTENIAHLASTFISAALTVEEVEQIKTAALAEIEAVNALDWAILSATAEVYAAAVETTREIADNAINDILNAATAEAAAEIRDEALAAMEEAMDELAAAKLDAVRELIAAKTDNNFFLFEEFVMNIVDYSHTVAKVTENKLEALAYLGVMDVTFNAYRTIDAAETEKNADIARDAYFALMDLMVGSVDLVVSLYKDGNEQVLNDYRAAVNSILETALADMRIADYYDGISLTLDSDIYMNFYMDLNEEEKANGTMTFTIGGRTVAGTRKSNDNGTYFSCPLTALEMAETVTAVFAYNGITCSKSYSVSDYIDSVLEGDYTDEAKTLARKLANYGHYVQKYLASIHDSVVIGEDGYAEMLKCEDFDIDLDLAKTVLRDYFKAPAKQNGIKLFARTVYFDSATALNLYVEVDGNEAPEASCEGKDVTVKRYTGKTLGKDNLYVVTVRDIAATELDNVLTVTIGGVDFFTSVLDYCGAVMQAHKDGSEPKDIHACCAMAAFFEYNQAAYAYAKSVAAKK